MNPVEVIARKKRGEELSREEIRAFVLGYARGEIPDYQAAAWLMAVCWRGMSRRETVDLTAAMVDSGRRVDLSGLGAVVDKHSTGGVGDKTTLVLAPLVAAAGARVAKMSGRGLGHTGGTLDKLESIPGMTVDLGVDRLVEQVRRVGIAVAGQTADLVPADGMLYALRDVTATVDSVPLIAASVMSKKIAGGAGAIALDVKYGRGAFMPGVDEAIELARAMVDIGAAAGRPTVAFVSAMDEPLGRTVGNALEVAEAIETLGGGGPPDLRDLCLALAGEMLALAGLADSPAAGRARAEELLRTGAALEKWVEFVAAQGGDPNVARTGQGLPSAPVRLDVVAPRDGTVARIDALEVGLCAMALGAGRTRKGEAVDPAVGLVLHRKVGDRVGRGDVLATLHAPSAERAEGVARRLAAALEVGDRGLAPAPLFAARVSASGVERL